MQMSTNKSSQLPVPPLLGKKDVAKLIGISEATVNRLVCGRQIPFLKLRGGLVRFQLGDILEWLEDQKVEQEERRTKGPAA